MRELLTTSLDLLGMLLVVAALVVLVWPYTAAGALAIAGVGLLGVSWLIDRRAPQRRESDAG